jgi:hypothetical protein
MAFARRLHRDYTAFTGVHGDSKAFALRLHGVFKAIEQRSRGAPGDSKAIAVRPPGVFTAIAAFPFKGIGNYVEFTIEFFRESYTYRT